MTKENRPAGNGAATTTSRVDAANASAHRRQSSRQRAAVASQQVSWWDVHEHVASFLERVGSWPMVGTPAWCALPDDDPAKIAALYDAAQHWALRVETCQQAECEASRAISAAADWAAIAQQIRRCRGAYIPRRAAS